MKSINPESVKENPFHAIGKEWMLIAAGTPRRHNMMTASWGAWGVLWHRNVVFCFVRPGRYTNEFLESSTHFTLNFFSPPYKKILNFCGTKSGRDVNKTQATGLTPVPAGRNTVYFAQARLVIVCRKIYFQQIDAKHFLDPSIEDNYPKKDYHRLYVGEIVRCLKK